VRVHVAEDAGEQVPVGHHAVFQLVQVRLELDHLEDLLQEALAAALLLNNRSAGGHRVFVDHLVSSRLQNIG